MKLGLYSIHDLLTSAYLSPFPARTDMDAIRQIKASMTDPQMRDMPIVISAQEYDLVCVGQFDDSSGEVVPQKPVVVLPLKQLREQVNEEFEQIMARRKADRENAMMQGVGPKSIEIPVPSSRTPFFKTLWPFRAK